MCVSEFFLQHASSRLQIVYLCQRSAKRGMFSQQKSRMYLFNIDTKTQQLLQLHEIEPVHCSKARLF